MFPIMEVFMLLVLVCLTDSREAEMFVLSSVVLTFTTAAIKSLHHSEMNQYSGKIFKHVYFPWAGFRFWELCEVSLSPVEGVGAISHSLISCRELMVGSLHPWLQGEF